MAGLELEVYVCDGTCAAQKSEEGLWMTEVITATVIELKGLSCYRV